MSRMVAVTAAATAAITMLVSACGRTDGGSNTLTVMAASSLTDVFEELANAFESSAAGSGIDVRLLFGGSSALAAQIAEGAPAQVVATANSPTMERIEDTGRVVGEVAIFAENELVVAVADDTDVTIENLADLATPGAIVAVCAEQVPCGVLTAQMLDVADVTLRPDTLEPSVRSVRTKVLLGEVDAGIVYATDVAGLAGIRVFTPDEAEGLTTAYPIARLDTGTDAIAFVDFVLSDPGQEILGRFGFLGPNP